MAKLTDRLKVWLASKTESCKHIAPLFSAALERNLSVWERLRIRIHLFTCSACQNYISNLKFMRDAFRNRNDSHSEPLSSDARERIKSAIRSAKNVILFALFVNLAL